MTLTAHAVTYEITGTIEEADGLAGVFFTPGEAVLGIIEADEAAIASGLITFSDLTYVEINYWSFIINFIVSDYPEKPGYATFQNYRC